MRLGVPQHVAIIMDGNGRWATRNGFPRLDGHKAGVDSAVDITRYCGELGVRYLTLYAFSSENWRRPADEVLGLMRLLYGYLNKECDELVKNGVRVTTIGATERLPLHIQKALSSVVHKTKNGDRLRLQIALSYGGRDEIVRAAQKLAQQAAKGVIAPESIDEEMFARHLDTDGLPDPDLFIRTGGDMRLSNFLLWQLSYTELYVTQKTWPEFDRAQLDAALQEYERRQRRFGMTSEQLETRL